MNKSIHGGKREGAGRRPLFDKTTMATTRIQTDIWDKIPSPKAKWIRDAIVSQAINQGIIEETK